MEFSNRHNTSIIAKRSFAYNFVIHKSNHIGLESEQK